MIADIGLFGKEGIYRYHPRMLSLLFQEPILFVIWVLSILMALTVHEFSHALIGTALGDETAKRMGRLTLNPAAHIDTLGLLALITVGFGWGKPVPYNAYNLRNQKWGPVLIALAGPGMNLAVAVTLGVILRLVASSLGDANLLVQFLYLSVYLNLALLFFNLIPIPPLDGSKVLLAILRDRPGTLGIRTWIETKGPWLLIGLIVADMVLNVHLFSGLFGLITGFMGLLGL